MPDETKIESPAVVKLPRYFLAQGKTLRVKRGELRGGQELLLSDLPKADIDELVAGKFVVKR